MRKRGSRCGSAGRRKFCTRSNENSPAFAEVERNTDWLDQAAYKSRVALLDRLNSWYETEVSQIDRALERIRRHGYGVCLACHHPIEPKRLATAPEAEYCSACQSTREVLTAA